MKMTLANLCDIRGLKDDPWTHYQKRSRHGLALWGVHEALIGMTVRANADRSKPVSEIGLETETPPNIESPNSLGFFQIIVDKAVLGANVNEIGGASQDPNKDDFGSQEMTVPHKTRIRTSNVNLAWRAEILIHEIFHSNPAQITAKTSDYETQFLIAA